MVARTLNRERVVGCPYRWKTVGTSNRWLYNDITRDEYNNICPLAEKKKCYKIMHPFSQCGNIKSKTGEKKTYDVDFKQMRQDEHIKRQEIKKIGL